MKCINTEKLFKWINGKTKKGINLETMNGINTEPRK